MPCWPQHCLNMLDFSMFVAICLEKSIESMESIDVYVRRCHEFLPQVSTAKLGKLETPGTYSMPCGTVCHW